MAPVVAEVALENQNTFSVARLNNDKNRATIQKYRIIGQPIYLVFKNGKLVGRFGGVIPKAELLQKIRTAIGA